MNRCIALYFVSLIMLTAGVGHHLCQAQQKPGSVRPEASLLPAHDPLPVSLDALYPPKSPQPVYLFAMLRLNMPLTGIAVDLFENDLPNAKANFEKFRSEYAGISALVPDWSNDFPAEPVNKLGTALETGRPEEVMSAIKEVGKVCHDCHTANMVKVQQKYHWPDFDRFTVTDPLTKRDADYAEFMQFLNGSFTGIAVDLQQGQTENARHQFDGFRSRFQALKESCSNCHQTERTYYVDAGVQGMIDSLGQELNAPAIDPKRIEALSRSIGQESCSKCHMVHLPAATAKLRWATMEKSRSK
jgi:mono/diheme cytochrome c family protein